MSVTGTTRKTCQLAYYQPARTETVTGLDLSTILVKGA